MRKLIMTIPLLFTCCINEVPEHPSDFIFKEFVKAYLIQDSKKIQSLSLYNEELNILYGAPTRNEETIKRLFKDLKYAQISWHNPGDRVKIQKTTLIVNELMSNNKRRVGNLNINEFPYLLLLKKMKNGEWKIDPTLMISTIKAASKPKEDITWKLEQAELLYHNRKYKDAQVLLGEYLYSEPKETKAIELLKKVNEKIFQQVNEGSQKQGIN